MENKYDKYIGSMIGDYIIESIYKLENGRGYFAKIKCSICGHYSKIRASLIETSDVITHSPIKCRDSYYDAEIGKVYGDYKVISFNRKEKAYVYLNVQCIKCGTVGVKSTIALRNTVFVHGTECFKNINGEYKELFSQRFNNMKQRCRNKNNTNYPYYGGRGILLEYDFVVDLYLDFIDEFTKHVELHGIENSSFDRIDVNGNYSKSNMRITTQSVQSTNTTRKVFFILKNKQDIVLCDNAIEFGRVYGINGRAIGNLVRGESKTSFGWELIAKYDSIDLVDVKYNKKIITT